MDTLIQQHTHTQFMHFVFKAHLHRMSEAQRFKHPRSSNWNRSVAARTHALWSLLLLLLSAAVCVWRSWQREERGTRGESSSGAENRGSEDGFTRAVIKSGESATVWLRLVGHNDLSSDQSGPVRPPSFGCAALTLVPRGRFVRGGTRAGFWWRWSRTTRPHRSCDLRRHEGSNVNALIRRTAFFFDDKRVGRTSQLKDISRLNVSTCFKQTNAKMHQGWRSRPTLFRQ